MSGLEGLLTGRTLVNRYRIEAVIGRGGFAAVYRANDQRLDRTVAVKVITLAASDEEARKHLRERFQREARSAASLPQHPNVITVHDFGTDPELGLDFLVMEFLHGEDLATHLARQRKLSLESALGVLRDAIEGVAVGHRENLIHRDVKPGNIFLAEPHGTDPFRVCVLDFGIAHVMTKDQTITRLTQGGVPLSPAYASPEQLRGDRNLTCASDVFSLGVVAYQLLTGEKPLRADRSNEPSDWIPEKGIRELSPEVPAEIEAVVKKAMSYDPEARYQDAGEMAQALDSAMTGVPVPAVAAAAAAPLFAGAALGAEDEHTLLHPEPSIPPHAGRFPSRRGGGRRTRGQRIALRKALGDRADRRCPDPRGPLGDHPGRRTGPAHQLRGDHSGR
jgi:eukaryotic-like serine/threonine-protein kinase